MTINLRKEWSKSTFESADDKFYNREETINEVKKNFDIRRKLSAESYDIVINGITETCLVQMPNNPLRELNDYRKIHCPITADVKRGYYVIYEDNVWIIDTNVANIDGAYLSTRMSRCQYILRWQNNKGKIVERWSYSSDQTKYSNGETWNNIITLGDNQYALLLPIDEETKLLKRNMRFAMDFEDSSKPDIYRLTNRKVNLNNELYFDRGGTMLITLTFSEFNGDKDKQVLLNDGRKVWICDYKEPSITLPQSNTPNKMTVLRAVISGNKNLKIGYSRTYTAIISDIDNNTLEWDNTLHSWNVVSDFEVEQTIIDNKIKLKVNDDSLIGSSFLLQCVSNETVIEEIKITVCDIV